MEFLTGTSEIDLNREAVLGLPFCRFATQPVPAGPVEIEEPAAIAALERGGGGVAWWYQY